MSALGELLQHRREELGYTLKDVSDALRIPLKYLKSIEEGKYTELPSYAHCSGFVKNYIKFLKMNETEALDLFHKECTRSLFTKQQDAEEKVIFEEVNKDTCVSLVKKRATIYTGAAVFFLFLAVLYLTVNIKRPADTYTAKDDNKPTLPVVAVDNNISPIFDNTPAYPADNSIMDNKAILSQLGDNATANSDNRSDNNTLSINKVKLTFYNVCWVNVRIDNKTEMDFIAKPGFSKEFAFNKFFFIDIGDASAIAINYGGQTIAGLGRAREAVKNLMFTVNNGKLVYEKK